MVSLGAQHIVSCCVHSLVEYLGVKGGGRRVGGLSSRCYVEPSR